MNCYLSHIICFHLEGCFSVTCRELYLQGRAERRKRSCTIITGAFCIRFQVCALTSSGSSTMVLCFEECVILRVITSVSFSGALRRQKKQVRLVPELRGCFGAAREHLLSPLSNEQPTHNRTCLILRGTSSKLCEYCTGSFI